MCAGEEVQTSRGESEEGMRNRVKSMNVLPRVDSYETFNIRRIESQKSLMRVDSEERSDPRKQLNVHVP